MMYSYKQAVENEVGLVYVLPSGNKCTARAWKERKMIISNFQEDVTEEATEEAAEKHVPASFCTYSASKLRNLSA